jgi:prophage antirepressor-like protein
LNLITQNFNNLSIRIFLFDNKEWFVAKDIASLLGYKDTVNAIKQHCKKSEKLSILVGGGEMPPLDPQTKLIPESDVWRLIIKSRLPEAEKIEEWIMEEVLPEIRKNGSYSVEKKVETEKLTPQKSLEIVETGIQILTKFRDLNPIEQIELDTFHKNETSESLLEKLGKNFENSYFLPTELGKMTGQTGAEINLILEKKGLQFRDENGVWKPTSSGKGFCLEIGNKFDQLKWKLETIF